MKKRISILLLLAVLVSLFSGCASTSESESSDPSAESSAEGTEESAAVVEEIDYVASLKLDMNSETAKQEVTVKQFIDGDTTHFNVPTSVDASGVLKARYIAINTPESTGKIEEYGKTAANFTKEKLSSATSIIVESDDANWNLDSTGSRYLVWVWYRTSDDEDYRNLNLEILQNGLAYASSSNNNRYGDTCTAALTQARTLGYNLYSGEDDPNFYYGDAIELDLKELRTNIEEYNGVSVAFEGVITVNDGNNGLYVEEYDSESGLYYGMFIYYGYNLNGDGLEILTVGNRVRIVGTVSYYEAGGTYQVSGLSYRTMKPDDPTNIQKIGEGYSGAYVEVDPNTFVNGTVTLESDEGEQEYSYSALIEATTVTVSNLYVSSVYTTTAASSSSQGAMTLTCQAEDGTVLTVRTAVLRDDNGDLITASAYEGKTITVRGVVDYYNGAHQIAVFTPDDITIISE
ncbi:MAG: thermonuclease family protein [Firmicutes bacterium]|nr:thermonuclease family protein [Bacillota bacterium]